MMLLLLLTSVLLKLVTGIEFTQPYVVQSSSDHVPLVDIFNFTRGGEAVVYLDVTLQATPGVVQGRTMMYLLLCDEMVFGDTYCVNRTLGTAAGCRTFPLRQSSFVSLYNQTSTQYHTITYLHIRVSEASAGPKFIFLDACEALGGTHGWLPSCMKNTTGLNTTCFACPDMPAADEDARSNCIVSPTIAPNITGQIDIAMCDGDGRCLGDSVADLLTFYMAYAALWIVLTLLWVAPLLKKPYLCIRLHYLFAIIALMETAYALLSCVTFASPLAPIQIFLQFGYSVVGALFLQFLCRCFTVQLVLMLADGYQVTQNGLENPTWISLDWTFVMFWTICRNASLYSNTASGPGVLQQIQWSVACYLMFSNYSHARRHVKRLRNLTFEMQVRLHIDPDTTPIMEKLRVFHALPVVFFTYFPLLWVNNQLNWMPIPHFIADHGIFTLLCLHLGYRFRVRRFYHEFLLAPSDTILPPPPPDHPTTFVLIQPPNPSEPTACGALAAPRSPNKPRQDPI